MSIQATALALAVMVLAACGTEEVAKVDTNKVVRTDAEWRARLTAAQYQVTREKGTERAFSGAYWDHKEVGVYSCVCCGTDLFLSDTKFDAGCGWPSYFAPVADAVIIERPDTSHGMVRTEIVCARCDAHLGHVFKDGPPPTGLRYCVNSAALAFRAPEIPESPAEEQGE